MEMDRETSPGIWLVSSVGGTLVTSLLDIFNRSLPHCADPMIVGRYKVFFSGFIPSQDTPILVGYWRAWSDVSTDPHLVQIVHGAGGVYEPGQYWDTRPIGEMSAVFSDDLGSDDGEQRLRVSIDHAKKQIEDLVDRVIHRQPIPKMRPMRLQVVDPNTGVVLDSTKS